MGEQTVDRKEFIGRIGTFLIVIGLFALMIFVSTDASRSILGGRARLTNTVWAAQAVQTRDAGAQSALALNQPTPTLVPVKDFQATQDYLVYGVRALQTRDTGAQQALLLKLPTPTLIETEVLIARSQSLNYISLFCLGSLGILAGLAIYRVTASAGPKASGRFEGLRKLRQKQKEAREKREAAKKEKEAKKKK